MKFAIERSEDHEGNLDFFVRVAADDNHDLPCVAVLEFAEEDDHFVSEISMKALRALMDVGDGDDSFAGAIRHIIEQAFRAGVDHAFSRDELSFLIGDLIKISRALKDGRHQLVAGELESTIGRLIGKRHSGAKYAQVVID
ncbi:hypothetical protein HY839_00635 [Candidatus Azambacteria bacterium]|nr:hypothetical protein [Candidatus Azambacteria bacterium]